MRMKRTLVVTAVLVLAACASPAATTATTGSSTDTVTDLATLTQEWGCGHGFYVGNPEQTSALRLQFSGDELTEREIDLPSPDWSVVLVHGTNLFSNWCDDVIEANEPTPVEHESLGVVAGHLSILGEIPEPFSGGTLVVEATGLEVELADGATAPLGDITITNPSWGFFAG